MTLQKIEFEYDIPDGYRFVKIGKREEGYLYLTDSGFVCKSQFNEPIGYWIIVEKIPEQEQQEQNPKRHKHADLIHAWAEGAVIQFEDHTGKWLDCVDNDPSWIENTKYRIKPKTKTSKFRIYLHSIGSAVCAYHDISNAEYFVRWLGDWQEVEIEDND